MIRISLIAGFYTLFLPGQLAGGGVSWYKLSRTAGTGVQAAALLIYFRVVNILVLLGAGLFGAWFDPKLAASGFRSWIVVLFVGTLLLALPFFSPGVAGMLERLVARFGPRQLSSMRIRSLGQVGRSTLAAVHTLAHPRQLAPIIGLSVLANGVVIYVFVLMALAVQIHLPIMVLGWVCTVITIVQMIPVSIAGLGVREAGLVLILQGYGIPAPQALSLSLTMFGVMVIIGLVGGLLELWDVVGRRCCAASRSR